MTLCRYPGCRKTIPWGESYCEEHKKKRAQAVKQETNRLSANDRGYTYKWQQASKGFLKKHPLCAMCEAKGIIKAAQVVDHIKPHKGDQTLFWDRKNWQPLCKQCHDRKTFFEDGGFGRPTKRGL